MNISKSLNHFLVFCILLNILAGYNLFFNQSDEDGEIWLIKNFEISQIDQIQIEKLNSDKLSQTTETLKKEPETQFWFSAEGKLANHRLINQLLTFISSLTGRSVKNEDLDTISAESYILNFSFTSQTEITFFPPLSGQPGLVRRNDKFISISAADAEKFTQLLNDSFIFKQVFSLDSSDISLIRYTNENGEDFMVNLQPDGRWLIAGQHGKTIPAGRIADFLISLSKYEINQWIDIAGETRENLLARYQLEPARETLGMTDFQGRRISLKLGQRIPEFDICYVHRSTDDSLLTTEYEIVELISGFIFNNTGKN